MHDSSINVSSRFQIEVKICILAHLANATDVPCSLSVCSGSGVRQVLSAGVPEGGFRSLDTIQEQRVLGGERYIWLFWRCSLALHLVDWVDGNY